MAMRRYPFDEMERMMERMYRAMWDGQPDLTAPFGGESEHSDINLSLDADDDGYVVLADMPGFEKEEIDLRYEDGSLSVEASHETNEESDTVARHYTRHVYERIHVPGEVLEEEITASYHNGVLEVHLPALETDEPDDGTRIDID